MRSVEALVSPKSEYFVHAPSRFASQTFLCPLQCGDFTYLPGYSLRRESFDSFLVMYILEGELTLERGGRRRAAPAGSFVYIDCYAPHAYSSETGCRCLWCHFDGPSARSIYDAVASRSGLVFSLPDPLPALRKLRLIFDAFKSGGPVMEPLLNKYLTDVVTSFLLSSPSADTDSALMAGRIAAYISEHLREDLRVEELAARAGLSPFHFIRVFKRETGFTPHEYILNMRMATAKYLLKNSSLTVKDICYTVGFSSESVFCGAFKRTQSTTPTKYRSDPR